MIHYHGGPITPEIVAVDVWTARHAMVSFANYSQIEIAAQLSHSFCLDNGAFSFWKAGKATDWDGYYSFVADWRRHPGFDFALIPDVIDGDEAQNDVLVDKWPHGCYGVPVWHLHESLTRLKRLCAQWPKIALGSSGQWRSPGSKDWWERMQDVMNACCEETGEPKSKLHGLRMMSNRIFTKLPFSSVDSTNVARNIGIDQKWKGTYVPPSKRARAAVLVARIESQNSIARWSRYEQTDTLPSRPDQQMHGLGSKGLEESSSVVAGR